MGNFMTINTMQMKNCVVNINHWLMLFAFNWLFLISEGALAQQNTPTNNTCSNLNIDTVNQGIQVNTTTANDQSFSKVIALNDGGWIITWSSSGQTVPYSSKWNVYKQRYDKCGVPIGNETLINTSMKSNNWLQDAVALSDGSYVTLWNHSKVIGENINNPGLYMSHYLANDTVQSVETLLKSFPNAYPQYSVSAFEDQNNFIVAWDSSGIKMQRYTRSGQLVGNEIASGYGRVGTIATLQDGGWVLVSYSSSEGVYMQRYNSAGLLVGTIKKINIQTSMNWHQSKVIGLKNGGWLVAIPRDGDPTGIRLLQYDANGVQVSSQLIATNHNFGPGRFSLSITELANSDWVVAWGSSGYADNNYALGAYMQRFDSNGTPVGNEIRANQYLTNYDFPPSIAALSDGGWVITWDSFGQDGDRHGVFMKRYNAQGNPFNSQILALTAPSATYQKIDNDPTKSGIIAFDKFMIELYDPLTDEPTGEYALFEADNFKLDILPGFKDVRIPMETLDTLGNPNSVTVNLISIVPGGNPPNTTIPVCAAAQIGATLTSDVEGTSFPAYSEDQNKFCIPNLAVPKVAILPGGTPINIAPDCYEVTLDTATTQKNGILKITNIATIDKNICQ
jgi:hypothetical protein